MLIDNVGTSLIAVLGILLPGVVLFTAIVREPRRYFRLERLAYSYPLGLSVLGMPLFVLSWAGVPMPTASWIVLWLSIAGAIIVGILRKNALREFWLAPGPLNAPRTRLSEFEWFLVLAIITCLGARFVGCLLAPLNDWDGTVMWALKAKVLYYNTIRTTDYFHNPNFAQTNQPYPLMLPFMYAWMCCWLGHWDDLGMMVLNSINLIVFSGLLYFTLRKFAVRVVALSVTAIMVSLPTIQWYTECGQADVPLMLISGAGLFCLFDWMQHRRWDVLLLSAILMSGALFTKQEGKIQLIAEVVAAVLLIWVAVPFGKRLRGFGQIAVFVMVALGWTLPWLVFQTGIKDWGYFYSAFSLGTVRWMLLPDIIQAWVGCAIHWRNQYQLAKWHILWVILAACLVASKPVWRHPWVYLLVVFAVHFSVMSIFFLATNVPISLGAVESGFERYMLTMLVPLWLVLAKCLDDLWQIWRQPHGERI